VNRQAAIALLAGAGLALLFGCDSGRIAGGTTETDNMLTSRLIDVDSVLPDWNHPACSATVATLRLDASNFDFQGSDSAGRDLLVLKEDGDSVPFEVVYWDDAAKLGRIEVRIDSTLLLPHARFVLKWHQTPLDRSDPTAVWRAIPDSQRLAIGSVPVADFEDGTDTTLLPTRPAWATSTATDSSSISSLAFVLAGGGRSGTALSIAYATTGSGFVVLKTHLVAGDAPRILRSMDSLVFWAKGTKGSSLFTAIEHDSSIKAWKLDTLDSAWTRVRVRPSDFMEAGVGGSTNLGWGAVRDSATDLTFILHEGTSFMIDDIRLYGIDREDLE
jgi:hypothetical protein